MADPEVEIKGTTFTISVIHLIDNDLEHVKDVLNRKMTQAPKFFATAPVIVNVSKVAEDVDFSALRDVIKTTGFVMVGVTGVRSSEQKQQCQQALIPVLLAGKDVELDQIQTTEPSIPSATKVVHGQVRSGQQIYAKDCDLVIIGSVSNGAEIIADGSIHVYGALRGRALAGANGQSGSIICCQNLQAELVSIAGHYQLSENLQPMWQQGCYIKLEARQIEFAPLN